MKRILINKLPVSIVCWIVIIGMVLISSPAFCRERKSSHDRDRTHENSKSNDRNRSYDRQSSHDRHQTYRRERIRTVRVVHHDNVLPAIVATGIVAGITLSLLDNDPAPAPPAVAPPACPANSGQVTTAGSVMVTAELLNIRSGPGLGKPCVGRLHRGVTLSILGTSAGWYYVQASSGMSGWVMAQYTTPVAAPVSG